MGSGFYKQIRGIFIAHGVYFVRQGKGSHEIWFSPIAQKHIIVAVTVTSRTMANVILKQAGITVKL